MEVSGPSTAGVNVVLGDDFVHKDIMICYGDLIEQLAFESESDEWSVGAGVLQEFVVIAFSVPHPSSSAVEADARDHDEVEFGGLDLFFGECAKFRAWFQNAVHTEFKFVHAGQAKHFEFPGFIAPWHNDGFPGLECQFEVVSSSHFTADIDVEHHSGSLRVFRKRHESTDDPATEVILVFLSVAIGVCLLAESVLTFTNGISAHGIPVI